MQCGDTWRAYRILMQLHFNTRAIVAFRPLQSKCIVNLLDVLLKIPKAFRKLGEHILW